MNIIYVGLDLGSSKFQQVALNHAGVIRVNAISRVKPIWSKPSRT